MSDIKTDYFPAEPTEKEEKRFTPINKIDRPDGWLATPGLFWGCNPDEHDISAQYILRTKTPYIYEHVLKGDSEKYTTFRRALFEEGYAIYLTETYFSLSDRYQMSK
jgi:hypothetical protein